MAPNTLFAEGPAGLFGGSSRRGATRKIHGGRVFDSVSIGSGNGQEGWVNLTPIIDFQVNFIPNNGELFKGNSCNAVQSRAI
jgi:hypothetical protein